MLSTYHLYHLNHVPLMSVFFLREGFANFAQASLKLVTLLSLPP
jgi:hypothetical protein